jgi:SAM-dependent methyltransferase
MILNLGCGHIYIEGAVNVDISPESRADIVHDLSKFPWPFEENTFTEVRADNIIEHLYHTVETFEELHRICQPSARIHFTVPHFTSRYAVLDPTHRKSFSAHSFNLFTTANDKTFFTKARFRIHKNQIVFHPSHFNRWVSYFANRHVEGYEDRWCWIFPAWFMIFELEVIK